MRLLLAICIASVPAAAQNYKILLVEGQGAINPVGQGMRRDFTVRVEQKYGAPAKRIPVTFRLPSTGPSGSFPDADQAIVVTTDDDGYAVVRGFRPNRLPGQYNIQVSASTPGGPVTAAIPQTNALVSAAESPSLARRLIRSLSAATAASRDAITGLLRKEPLD